MKICTNCNIEKEYKDFTFDKSKQKYEGQCKKCRNLRKLERKKNPDLPKKKRERKPKEYYQEYRKKWHEENRDHVRKVVHEHYLKNRESVIERTKKWRQSHKDEFKRMHGLSKEKYRDRWRARKNLNYHLQVGNIIKAKYCDICGKEKKLQAHHDDYSKPLAVKWICSSCHGYIHREFK